MLMQLLQAWVARKILMKKKYLIILPPKKAIHNPSHLHSNRINHNSHKHIITVQVADDYTEILTTKLSVAFVADLQIISELTLLFFVLFSYFFSGLYSGYIFYSGLLFHRSRCNLMLPNVCTEVLMIK